MPGAGDADGEGGADLTDRAVAGGGPAAPGAPLEIDGPTVAAAPTAIDVGDLEPGDLVFVGAERTRLGTLIVELDGCRFSHVGVLWDPDRATMVSARTDRRGGLHRPDLGGVRVDALAPLAGRGLWAAPLVIGSDRRETGLARLRSWCEDAGPVDPVSRSRFSFVKLVSVSVALASVRRRDPHPPGDALALWEAARRAAVELAAGPAPGGAGSTPGFYCAELVSLAFGLRHHAPSFPVPDGEPHPGVEDPAIGSPARSEPVEDAPVRSLLPDGAGAVPTAVAELGSGSLPGRWWSTFLAVVRALDEVDLTAAQLDAAVDLLVAVVRIDPGLTVRLLAAAAELRGSPETAPPVPPLPPGSYRPPDFVRDGDALPAALVTPRMLLSRSLVAEVRPLRLPLS